MPTRQKIIRETINFITVALIMLSEYLNDSIRTVDRVACDIYPKNSYLATSWWSTSGKGTGDSDATIEL